MNPSLEKLEQHKVKQIEINRISTEVISLTNDSTNIDFIKKFISSVILNEKELNDLITKTYNERLFIIKDKEINKETILKCLLAFILATIIGSSIWGLTVYYLEQILYPLLIVIYATSYFVVRIIVKKSHRNLLVFTTTLIASIASPIIAYYFLKSLYDI